MLKTTVAPRVSESASTVPPHSAQGLSAYELGFGREELTFEGGLRHDRNLTLAVQPALYHCAIPRS